jgi:NitT/TauT family transport system permease protein
MPIPGLSPNQRVSASVERGWYLVFVGVAAVLWLALPSKIIPSPWAVVAAIPGLFGVEGFGQELWISIALNLQAALLMALVSLLVGYATTIAAFRPVATAFAAGRFNSFVGLPLILTLLVGTQHVIKVIMLATAGAVFSVQPIQDIILAIPKEKFDDARTLRMGEWRVVWEVVILGTFDQVLDVLRTNAAMIFMALPMVEGMFRSEGGIGVFLLDQNKYMRLDNVYAAVIIVSLVGLGFDRLILGLKHWVCPSSFLGREQHS